MFDNTQQNKNDLNLEDLNQGKAYPFKPINSEKKLSGLKGPVEDILAESEHDLPVSDLSSNNQNNKNFDLRETPKVPSMSGRVAANIYNPNNSNANITSITPIYSEQKKSKFVFVLIIFIVVLIFGLAIFFAYNYFAKTKNSETLTPNDSLQKLIKTLNEESVNNIQSQDVNQENKNSGSQPEPSIDSDNDGLGDEVELQLGTNSTSADTDNDGLNDFEEVNVYKTSPVIKDTDGDGYDDGAEVKNGFDPAKPGDARLANTDKQNNKENGLIFENYDKLILTEKDVQSKLPDFVLKGFEEVKDFSEYEIFLDKDNIKRIIGGYRFGFEANYEVQGSLIKSSTIGGWVFGFGSVSDAEEGMKFLKENFGPEMEKDIEASLEKIDIGEDGYKILSVGEKGGVIGTLFFRVKNIVHFMMVSCDQSVKESDIMFLASMEADKHNH